MLTLTVAQAKEADQNQPISGLKGRVKVVFKPRTGNSNGRDWSNQGIVVADLSDPKQEVTLTVWNQPEYDDSIKGKVITVTPGPKGGLKGGGTYEKTGRNGAELVYKVDADKSCDIVFDDGGGQAQRPAQQPQQSQRAAAPAGAPQRNAPAQPQSPAQGGMDWTTFLAKEQKIMSLCVEAAARVCAAHAQDISEITGGGVDGSAFMSLVATIRISGQRAGLDAFSPTKLAATSHPPVDPGQSGGPDDDDVPFGG